MEKNVSLVIFILLLVVIVVSVDLLFFRHHFLDRLIANIGIVLVFIAFFLRFMKHQ